MRGCGLLRLRERGRRRRLEVRVTGPGLGDNRLPVEQAHQTVLPHDRERPVEWRGRAKGHLRGSVDERREPPGGVAAVPRVVLLHGNGAQS